MSNKQRMQDVKSAIDNGEILTPGITIKEIQELKILRGGAYTNVVTYAREKNNSESLRYLYLKIASYYLENEKAESDFDYLTLLDWAVILRQDEKINELARDQKLLNHHSMYGTTLHLAVNLASYDRMLLLLEAGVNVGVRTQLGATPLHFATNEKIASKLIECSWRYYVDFVNVKDDMGLTPLHYAAFKGNAKVLTFLLQQENILKNIGCFHLSITPLHLAVREGKLEAVRVLCQNKVKIDLVDIFGLTPLHYAGIAKNVDIAKLLLDHNADPNKRIKSKITASPVNVDYHPLLKYYQPPTVGNFKTILELVTERGHDSPMIDLLLTAEAKTARELMQRPKNTLGFKDIKASLNVVIRELNGEKGKLEEIMAKDNVSLGEVSEEYHAEEISDKQVTRESSRSFFATCIEFVTAPFVEKKEDLSAEKKEDLRKVKEQIFVAELFLSILEVGEPLETLTGVPDFLKIMQENEKLLALYNYYMGVHIASRNDQGKYKSVSWTEAARRHVTFWPLEQAPDTSSPLDPHPLKQLDEAMDRRGENRNTPAASHPWRQYKRTTGVVFSR